MSSSEVPASTLPPEALPLPAENAGGEPAPEPPQEPTHTLNPECVREVEVEVPAEEVSREIRKIVKRYQRAARIPGFRIGKVPESLIRSRFQDQIRHDAFEAIVPGRVQAAIAEKNLAPVSQPQATGLNLEDGKPLQFKVVFEVLPEISLEGYGDVTVEKPDTALTEAEVEQEIERLRDAHSVMEPVEEERGLADGDYASISYTGRFGGTEAAEQEAGSTEAPPISGDEVLFEVGGRDAVESFNEALRGKRSGEHVSFETTYPEDFGESRLAGKTVAYQVEVKGIKKKILPELDDAFARQVGDYENYEAFSKHLREVLETNKRQRVEADTISHLVDALAERFDFPVPESLIAEQVDRRLDRGLRILAMQGMTPEAMRRLDLGRLREQQRAAAISEIKGSLLLDRIAELENVEVSDEDVTEEIARVAGNRNESVDATRRRLTENDGLARIREQLRREKIGRMLYERLPS